jgi:hypothetical protein
MTTRTWIRRLFARTPRTIRKAPARYRPRLEALEGRLAPAILTVNSTADNTTDTSVLTLREAIAIVNTSPDVKTLSQSIQNQISGALHGGGRDTIGFDHTQVTSAITLVGMQMLLTLPSTTATITIDGGSAGVTVDGNNSTGIFLVDTGAQAVFTNLTLQNGSDPHGGGIDNAGAVTVSNCTLSGNSAAGGQGGGIYNTGTLTASNCTLSGNSAAGGQGGGIYNTGTLTVSNCTLSGNSADTGGGIANADTLTLNNTIVANSPGGGVRLDWGTITGSHNLIDDGFDPLSDTITGDPKLDPNGLQNNGGPTQTIKLLPTSPAAQAGMFIPGIDSTDQRGHARGLRPDLGAYQIDRSYTLTVNSTADALDPDANVIRADAGNTSETDTLGGTVTLRDALNAARNTGGTATINLQDATYTLNAIDNYWYGPDGLPAISSPMTLEGNGATIARDTVAADQTPAFRLFYVSGGLDGLPAGNLTLHNLTLEGGLAQGGDSNYGGGGAGMGGAIFTQGTLTLNDVTVTGNTAQGGSSGDSSAGNGGGGMGSSSDLSTNDGGGFGGPLGGPYGGKGNSAGGGGGFSADAAGVNGAGQSGLGGPGGGTGGDGGGGNGGGGGDFGSGGVVVGHGFNDAGVGGFGGGGGGGGGSFGDGGGGGVGGGGGKSGGGGFGGGGGGAFHGGGGGFGGGGGSPSFGGGGAGMGGAIFNHQGTLLIVNSTLTANTAQGGNTGYSFYGSVGSGLGGAVFNLNGGVTVVQSTLDANTVTAGNNPAGTGGFGSVGGNATTDGGEIYNLAYGNFVPAPGVTGPPQPTTATLNLVNSILADSVGPTGVHDLVDDAATSGPSFTNPNNTAPVNAPTANPTLLSAPILLRESATAPSGNGLFTGQAKLGPLTLANGGLTPTMALGTGSDALAKGAATTTLAGIIIPTVDQRGVNRAAPCDLGAFTVESPAQQAADLQARVVAQQQAGHLNQGQANSLIVKLNLKGNSGDIGKVQAFLQEVNDLFAAGILTQTQANDLLVPGNILLLSVTGR